MSNRDGLTTPDAILRAALRKEQQAHEFYAAMAADCPVALVRDLLISLQNEESKHIRMIEGMIARMESGADLV